VSDTKNVRVINSFADAISDFPEITLVPESMFLVFASCAFFSGAESHLQKMANLEPELSRRDLIKVIESICHLGAHNAEDALENIESYAKKYYVIEHISEEGEIAAEEWLNCAEKSENTLRKIIIKYRDLTLADLGIEGVNPRYQLQQKLLIDSVDRSIGKLRRRSLMGILLVLLIVWGGLQVLQSIH